MGISFSRPWYLILLLLGVYFFYLWQHSFRGFRAWQQKAFLGLRLLIVLLIVFALAGLQLEVKHTTRSTVFVADVSASVADAKKAEADWINRSLAALPLETKAGVVSFGKKGAVEYPVGLRPDFTGLQAVVDKNYSDLASGLRLARSLLPEDQAKQIVLLTDGKQNRDDALELAKTMRQQGIRLDVLPLATESGPEAQVKDMSVPSHLKEGEAFNLKVNLESTAATSGTVRIKVDNRVLRQAQVQLSKGSNNLVWGAVAEAPGLHTYSLELVADQDTRTENNVGIAITEVEGMPRVLLVEGSEGDAQALALALNSVKIDAETVAAEAMPKELTGMAKYATIVLINVPAMKLADKTMIALENYVKDLGRGLVMIGGEDSFGPGGYYKTPVEQALPVHMDIRKKGEIPSIGLGLVIDKSGSMCHTMNGVSKLDMAKEAAIRSTEILEARDQLGVITFDSEYKWVVETSLLKNKQEVQDKIGSIRPSGGTNMFPALEAAYNSLKEANVKVKHIILLTDGVSPTAGSYDDLLQKMNEARITLTTVAVGADSDTGLLQRLAQLGKGRYYFTDDISSIPKIFAKETFLAARSYIVQEPFIPVITGSAALLPAGQVLPPLLGYVGTTAKDSAEAILSSHQNDPVLARWNYGLGRAVAWTSDAKGRWAGEWIGWNGFPQFWGKVLAWAMPQGQDNGMALSTAREGGQGRISVDIPNERRQTHDLLARIVAPDGTTSEVVLPAEGPGRYQASFPMEQQGAYMIQVVQRSGDKVVRQSTAGLVQPYSPEYILQPEQREFLAALAEAGGGKLLRAEDSASMVGDLPVEPVRGKVPLGFPLLSLAALLFPVDIAARRFNLHLRWIGPLWHSIRGRIFGTRVKPDRDRGPLLEIMQQQKESREQFYQARTREQSQDYIGPLAASDDSRSGNGARQVKQTTAADPQGQAADQPEGGFTSRLLAAKNRAGNKK